MTINLLSQQEPDRLTVTIAINISNVHKNWAIGDVDYSSSFFYIEINDSKYIHTHTDNIKNWQPALPEMLGYGNIGMYTVHILTEHFTI